MKVSYIVPVYKVEQYISQCVESILAQTYTDFEILLVDDGSPDECPALCDELAAKDSRIVVIHKENGGLSDARNAGLKKATGDNVVFIDGDDFWTRNDSLQKLVTIASEHKELDFIGFNCNYYYPDSNKMTAWVPYVDELAKPTDKNKVIVALVKSGTFPMSACLKLLKRDFLIENELFFKKGQIAEDIPWFINVLNATDKCCFVNEYVYAYRQNVSGSITASGGERSFNNLLDIIYNEIKLIEKRRFTDEAKGALLSFLGYELSILISTVNTLPKKRRGEARKELKKLCWLLKYRTNPKVRMVGAVYKLGGFCMTETVLRCYDWYRERRN